ncbi:MAG TPA: hypothetical protein VGL94_05975 [Ktedonobacteraceae bacterium]|jgi:hypothetical protein
MADTQPQTQSRMANISARSGQRVQPSGQRAIQESIASSEAVTCHQMQPHYPNWPTSKPGPLAKQAPLGQRPINLLRREQMVEVG